MIAAIQDEVRSAVSSMDTVTERVHAGVALSGKAGETLHKVVDSISELQSLVLQPVLIGIAFLACCFLAARDRIVREKSILLLYYFDCPLFSLSPGHINLG
jgi:methyl-accepting chemotaxis protein